eukprot:TRINITY_DN21733_c0_g1_i2.p1 TRINITY_DN21733_c0_g1~~TRINITY_DN21733_c0_g1_i2.p1  ORF type:complete len:321 (-),score=52.13 TRINITY_DN21733_c0_g1_i2:177-1139(-)
MLRSLVGSEMCIRDRFKYRGSVARPDVLIRSAVPRLFDLTGIHLADAVEGEIEGGGVVDDDDGGSDEMDMDEPENQTPRRRRSSGGAPLSRRSRQPRAGSWAGPELTSGSIVGLDNGDDSSIFYGGEESSDMSSSQLKVGGSSTWDFAGKFQMSVHSGQAPLPRRRSSNTPATNVDFTFGVGGSDEGDHDKDEDGDSDAGTHGKVPPPPAATIHEDSENATEGDRKRARERKRQERAKGVLNRVCRATRACAVGYVAAMEPVVKMCTIPQMPPLWCFTEPNSQTQFSLDSILANTERLIGRGGSSLRTQDAYNSLSLIHI